MESEDSLPHSQVPATVPILTQLDPVHTPTSHFLKTHLNIILISTTGFPKGSLFFLICVYWLQPVLHHLGIPRDIYRSCTVDPIYQFTFKVLSQYLDGTFWSVRRV